MTLWKLLWRSLAFHWRGNLPVLLGVAVGTAVLTGALLVGDSLQGSLRDEALRRLGWVDQALVAPRFFRQALADEVAAAADARVSPALLLQATATAGDTSLRGVSVLGVETSFFLPGHAPERFGTTGGDGEALTWLAPTVAEALGVVAGDRLTLRLPKPADVPREASLGKKDAPLIDWTLRVAAVLPADALAARFNLRPELAAPRNLVVALPQLQQQLGFPGQVNGLFAAGNREALNVALSVQLRLEDWGLVLRTPETRARELVRRYDTIDRDGRLSYSEWLSTRLRGKDVPRYAGTIEDDLRPASRRIRTFDDFRGYYLRQHPYLSLESRQLLLSPAMIEAAQRAAKDTGLRAAPTLVYLARVEAAGRRIAGVVAALDPADHPPLGPFLPPGKAVLADDEIVLLDHDWSDGQRPAIGSEVTLRYKPPESHGPTPDRRTTLRLAGWLPPRGAAADPGLTPEFPGITDKEDLGAWELPFDDADWEKNVNREYGDAYWKQYRATPKAYVNLTLGQRLWASRFGELTSLRLALPQAAHTAETMEEAGRQFETNLLAALDPASGGFAFDAVKADALRASRGGTPFGLLFLGFSFFLILSALLLVGLLFRLNLDRRARQLGVLFATGYPRRSVTGLLAGEGLLVSVPGVLVGTMAAIAYSRLLLQLLTALWPGGTLRSFLTPHATATSLLAGAGSTLLVSLGTIVWVARGLTRVPPRALLAGATTGEGEPGGRPPARWMNVVLVLCLLFGALLLLIGPLVPGHEAQAGTFFGAGAMFLTAGMIGFLAWTRRKPRRAIGGHGLRAVGRLGMRNAARHPLRSLLTVGLLASAAFLLVAVESFRRHAPAGDGDPAGADGGFALVGESDLPIIRDLNSPTGRRDLLAALRGTPGVDLEEARALLEQTHIVALRARAGDDASCLNLYQPGTPRLLGVPRALIERGGFTFASTLASNAEQKANPWRILQGYFGDNLVPASGEANTVAWMLKSGLGKTITVPDGRGAKQDLLVAGLLHDSAFQSSLLISEEQFLRLYPDHEGYHVFLIAPPRGREVAVARLLELALADRGLEVAFTADRVAAYLAVENTYLTTFQALGGLGLVLGSLGLAVVLLRAVWERRAELALLRALGYRRTMLGWLVLAETGFLLLVGLGIGAAAALLSITPQLLRGAGQVPWSNLAVLFAGVLAVALAATLLAVAATLRATLVPALRRE